MGFDGENADRIGCLSSGRLVGGLDMRRIRSLVVVLAVLTSVLMGSSTALAETSGGGDSGDGSGDSDRDAYTCSGTFGNPGILAGTHSSVLVKGACFVASGQPAVVRHNLTILAGGALNAAFGGSDLKVEGNIAVRAGGILVLGCEPFAFTCFNDPDQQNGGTLSTHDTVGGNLVAKGALMVLAHNNKIEGNITQTGGGGGVNCSTFPLGPNGPPAYTGYEDNTVGGKISITGLQSCWLGVIRNKVDGSVNIINDQLADPDAIEINNNHIEDNLNCHGNSFVWDSAEASFGPSLWPRTQTPNTVGGERTGQCDILQNPAQQGDPPGPLPF
jgi:hypothetical protein